VRGKVEGLELMEEEVPTSEKEAALATSRAHWLFALGELEEPGRRPCLVLVAGLLALGGFAGLVSRQNARLHAANEGITRQRNRAETSGTLARRAVNEMLHEVARSDPTQPQPSFERLAECGARNR